jgi:phosphatidylserine/phosphatidylglycerophosphate/cardiolipin synthase-like enzyme
MSFNIINTDDTIAAITRLITDARRVVCLVSPYFSLSTDARFVEAIRGALERKVRVAMFIRADDNRSAEWDVLTDLVRRGMELKAVPKLHAKIYWSDAGAVVSSLNLLKSSFEKSIEIGLVATDETARKQVVDYIEKHVRPREDVDLKSSGNKQEATTAKQMSALKSPPRRAVVEVESAGFCIRCGEEVNLDPERPYCRGCFDVWRRYENPDYEEEFCHACGDEFDTSLNKPLCKDCYRAA